MASSLARPPALRMTWASPSLKPAYLAGSRRASMQVRMAKWRAGGRASSRLGPEVVGVGLVGASDFAAGSRAWAACRPGAPTAAPGRGRLCRRCFREQPDGRRSLFVTACPTRARRGSGPRAARTPACSPDLDESGRLEERPGPRRGEVPIDRCTSVLASCVAAQRAGSERSPRRSPSDVGPPHQRPLPARRRRRPRG